MSRNSPAARLAVLVLLSLGALHAEGNYRLLPYPEGPCLESSGCVPLILIHGIHGADETGPCGLDANPAADCNWSPLLARIAQRDPVTWRKLRVYIFRYLSDRGDPVTEIGRQLWLALDLEHVNWDRRGIIVAQSMGGLVARAFLAYQPPHPFLPSGRALVHTTITLGTPHHGTPLANRALRNRLSEHNTGASSFVLDLFDVLYWNSRGSSHLSGNPALPNRSDLLWDDYDTLFAPVHRQSDDAALERNQSIQQIQASPADGQGLIVYGGYIPAGPEPAQLDSNGGLLRTSYSLLATRLGKPWNDGLVPIDSALFEGNARVLTRRIFPGYDHQDMMGFKPTSGIRTDLQNALNDTVAIDIAAAVNGTPAPRTPRARY